MDREETRLNEEVTTFLDGLTHPQREEIERLRQIILLATPELEETVKWNGPNYSHQGQDRITMRIHPPGQLQLIFHRGAKVLEQPADRLINAPAGLLTWKSNDRAVAGFKTMEDILAKETALVKAVNDWLAVSSPSVR